MTSVPAILAPTTKMTVAVTKEKPADIDTVPTTWIHRDTLDVLETHSNIFPTTGPPSELWERDT